MDARRFLSELRSEVAGHAAVGHSLLGRCKIDPRSRSDFRVFSGQHYPLVVTFTRYLEVLLVAAPSSQAKTWLAKVLVDEYGERSSGQDHATHYRHFLRACGWPEGAEEQVPLHPAVPAFIRDHVRLCTREPFLVGLGAVGPGHEWAIPSMFCEIIHGLRAAGFAESEIGYFTLHTEQDVDHAAWLEEALVEFATTAQAQAEIRRGCLESLAARERLWWGIADAVTLGSMHARFPGQPATQPVGGSDTLVDLRGRMQMRIACGWDLECDARATA